MTIAITILTAIGGFIVGTLLYIIIRGGHHYDDDDRIDDIERHKYPKK